MARIENDTGCGVLCVGNRRTCRTTRNERK